MITRAIKTPVGIFLAGFTHRGLARLEFPKPRSRSRSGPGSASSKEEGPRPSSLRQWEGSTRQALLRALTGRAPGRLPPLDLTGGSDFQRDVWTVLRRIRPGQTRSYAEVARAAGNPQAARAAGTACGANPIPVFIPCHRVLPKSGGLGGFSAGLAWKRQLLEREGIKP